MLGRRPAEDDGDGRGGRFVRERRNAHHDASSIQPDQSPMNSTS